MNFGTDTSCTDTARTGRLVSGARLVAEACYRRLTTPRGELLGGESESNYGEDLSALIGQNHTPAMLASIPSRIDAELTKDERVLSVDVVVRVTQSGPSVSYDIDVAVNTNAGPFTLAIRVDNVTTSLLKIGVGNG